MCSDGSFYSSPGQPGGDNKQSHETGDLHVSQRGCSTALGSLACFLEYLPAPIPSRNKVDLVACTIRVLNKGERDGVSEMRVLINTLAGLCVLVHLGTLTRMRVSNSINSLVSLYEDHPAWIRAGVTTMLQKLETELYKEFEGDTIRPTEDKEGRVLRLSNLCGLGTSLTSEKKFPLNHFKSCYSNNLMLAESYADEAIRAMMTLFTGMSKQVSAQKFRNLDFASAAWRSTFKTFRRKYIMLWYLGMATKWLKISTATAFAQAAAQELPPQLEGELPGTWLSGVGYVFLKWAKAHRSRLALCNNILMFKKGLPPVHSIEVEQGVNDSFKVLTEERAERVVNVLKNYRTAVPVDRCTCKAQDLEIRVFGNNPPVNRMFECAKCRIRPAVVVPEEPVLYPFLDVPRPDTLKAYADLEYRDRLKLLVVEVRRTVYELFHGQHLSQGSYSLPSVSSHYKSGKKKGGAFGQLVKLFKEFRQKYVDITERKVGNRKMKFGSYVQPSRVLTPADGPFNEARGWGVDIDGTLLLHYSYRTRMFQKYHTQDCEIPAECAFGSYRSYLTADQNEEIDFYSSENLDPLRDFHNFCIERCLLEPNSVSPIGLSEPLKVRVITMGPVLRYFVGKPVQQACWKILARHPTFRLIGAPVTEEILETTLGELDEGEVWLSADYKSATDFLHPDLSASAAYEISRELGLGFQLTRVFIDGLTNSVLHHNGESKSQMWGQLMGSPLSFPILCIVNAAIQRFFRELETGLSLTLRQCPLLVNGDDVASKIRPTNYGFWKGMVSDGGLVPSIGKNYVSEDFLVINSTLFLYKGLSIFQLPLFHRSPYLNLSLIHPRDACIYTHDPYVKDLSQMAHKAIDGFDLEMQDWIMGQFLGWSKVRDALASVPMGVSYFVDQQLGGVGLPVTRDGLLTSKQSLYYSNLAEGLFEPFRERPEVGGGAVWCLQNLAKRTTYWDDWFLSEERPAPQPLKSRELWDVASRMEDPSQVNQLITDGAGIVAHKELLWNVDWSIDISGTLLPWPVRTLAKFPYRHWRAESVDSRGDACVSFASSGLFMTQD